MMKKGKIAVVTLGHYVYFEQFESLREELMQKADQFVSMLDGEACEIVNAGYVDRVEESFAAVQALKREDVDLLFHLRSVCRMRALCAVSGHHAGACWNSAHGAS